MIRASSAVRHRTELLILAEKSGMRVKTIPVRWAEDSDSRVQIGKTVAEDLRGLWRLRTQQPWRRLSS